MIANIWTGESWEQLLHGRSRCRKCGASHRVSFVWSQGRKLCTLASEDTNQASRDTVLLVENYIGFRVNWLRQFNVRQFRCSGSILEESSTILQTYPAALYPGAVHVTERALQTWLGAASKIYMLLQDSQRPSTSCGR